MKKISIALIICIISTFLLSFGYADNSIAASRNKLLPAIEVKGKVFSPGKGVKLSRAKEMIIKYLQSKGVKGDIGSSAVVTEITVKEAWDNNSIQLYSIKLDYAWIYGTAIVKNGKVLCILDGMPTWKVFLADLDSDSRYEIYTDVSFGSGIVSNEIRGYNIATNTEYSLSMRMQKDLFPFILNKTLWVKEVPYSNKDNEASSIGKLAVKSAKDKKGLYIKSVKPADTINNIFPILPKNLEVDMVGSGKQVKITNLKVIKQITDTLNSVELKPFSKNAEMGLMASSVGGLKITPDNKENETIYVHGAGALYLNESDRADGRLDRIVFQMPKKLIDKLYVLINLREPPEISVTLDNKSIGCMVTREKWNGAAHEGEDAFKSILKKGSKIPVPYIKLGKKVNIEFRRNPPDTVKIYDYILNEDGSKKFDDRTKIQIPVTLKDGKCSFDFKGNLAVALSSSSEDYKQGKTLRGFQVICKWNNASSDECEYGFVIRTDAVI